MSSYKLMTHGRYGPISVVDDISVVLWWMAMLPGSVLDRSAFCTMSTADFGSIEGRILYNLSVVDLCNLGCCCKYLKRILNSSKFDHVWNELWRGILRQSPRSKLLRWIGVACHVEHRNPTRETSRAMKNTCESSRSIVLRAVRKGTSVAKYRPVYILSKLQSERGPVLGLRAAVLWMGIRVIVELNNGSVVHPVKIVESSSKSGWAGEGLLVEPGILKHNNTRTFALSSTLKVPELPPDEVLISVRVIVIGNGKEHELLKFTLLDDAKRVITSQDGFTVLATHDGTAGCTFSAAVWEESLAFLYVHISQLTLWTSVMYSSLPHCSLTESGSLLLPTTTETLLLAVSLRTFRRPLWEGISQEFTREEYLKSDMTIIFPHPTGIDGSPQSRRLQCGPDLPFSYPTLNATGKCNFCVLLDCVLFPGCGRGIYGDDICNFTGQPVVLSRCSKSNVQFGCTEALQGQVYLGQWGVLHIELIEMEDITSRDSEWFMASMAIHRTSQHVM